MLEAVKSLVFSRFKLYMSTLPVILEITALLVCFFAANAVLFHGLRVKHTATLLKEGPFATPAGINREKPREHYAKKFFQNQHGLWIHYCTWKTKVGVKPKAVAVLLHGHSEHVRRHEHVAEELAENGYFVFGIDHQGFGRSEGDRAHVEKFEHYVDDVTLLFQDVILKFFPEFLELPKFIMAHSMGGLIGVTTAIRFQKLASDEYDGRFKWLDMTEETRKKLFKLSGLVASAPGLDIGSKNGAVAKGLLSVVAYLFPKMKLLSFPSNPSTKFLQAKFHSMLDPLNYNQLLRPHHTLELIKAGERARDRFAEFTTPAFVIHGEEDSLVDVSSSRNFVKGIATPEKDIFFLELEDKGHEPLQDERAERKELIMKMLKWMNERV